MTMSFLQRFLANHVLANLTFCLILVIGSISYFQMPRAKDPEINFNWINIITFFPGASTEDVEKRITNPIEDDLRSSIKDIKFVSSTSREGISNILIRFNQISKEKFDSHLTDLRREVQNTYSSELPEEAEDPVVYEITTSNAFPSATVVVTSAGDDENLRRQARNIKKDLELIKGVDRINDLGLDDPELHITFIPERLEGLGITPGDLSDTVRAYFRDVSAGDIRTDDGQWIVSDCRMEHQVQTDEKNLTIAVNIAGEHGPFDCDVLERDQHLVGALGSHRTPCPELVGERKERADDAVDDGPGLADLDDRFAVDAEELRFS